MALTGWKHSPEARERIAASNRARWADPAKRAAASDATKTRMADPAVRQRIKDGMRGAAGQSDELRALRALWGSTSQAARIRFITELFVPLKSANSRDDRDDVQ